MLQTPIEFLKGVGTARAQVLQKELSIFTFEDLLGHYPFRYVDKTKFHRIIDISAESETVQLKGVLRRLETVGEGSKKRLVGRLRDATGAIDLIWFQGARFLEKSLQIGSEYIVYGKVTAFLDKFNIPHPEMELATESNPQENLSFAPVYPSTELLNSKGLDAKGIRKLMQQLFEKIKTDDLAETLPNYLLTHFQLPTRFQALRGIHFPNNTQDLQLAQHRLKFEELFFLQLRLLQLKQFRHDTQAGFIFEKIGNHFNTFYHEKLPFALTNAQKRVLKEIRKDLATGKQMNRLLQGDVGSGKTIVALLAMLMALDNGYQACLMAPTEILAQQHFASLSEYLNGTGVRVAFLSGSTSAKQRKEVFKLLEQGEIHLLIGTHALIEPDVKFHQLGLVIIDEQHRFGVEQRAKLWKKTNSHPPHVLVMTATPIPRTLAMTLYGDLDVSVLDELPPGRQPVQTLHKTENHRLRVLGFMREEIAKGRQVYVVYPLIEESEKLDLLNLEQGHEALLREFPQPEYQISVVHGKMKNADKDFEMQRFVKAQTQIMVATTVIEVGVNVPNASVMVIENAERFGLSQLHQLRGRVGRGAEKSYCILLSSYKLSHDARERLQMMCNTNDGFKIAEADLRLRGPGNMEGTQQSGVLNFKIADLAKDQRILQTARETASEILEKDRHFALPEHAPIKAHLQKIGSTTKVWSRIS